MTVGYMSGSKKARSSPSITNNTNIFGNMGGLASVTGKSWFVRNAILHNSTTTNKIPLGPLGRFNGPGYRYMKQHNLLSKNPACTGGVGRTQITLCFRV
jgi:hypothetical protein